MKKKSNWLLSLLALLALLVAGRMGLLPMGDSAAPESDRAPAVAQSAAEDETYIDADTDADTDANADASDDADVPDENGSYTDKTRVAAYLNAYGHLPDNFITKKEAQKLGLGSGRTLDEVAPGKSIGGDHFGNYENQLPEAKGRSWRECDIDYVRGGRNAKRIVYSSDGLIYYTHDHYKTFERLY